MLSATTGGVSIIWLRSIIGAAVGIASVSFVFSLTTGIVKKLLNITKKKEKTL